LLFVFFYIVSLIISAKQEITLRIIQKQYIILWNFLKRGGKGMKYIVKNCPSCTISPSCCAKYHIDNGRAKDCQDIEDCVIKQVIDRCLYYQNKVGRTLEHRAGLLESASNILQLFDIEEVGK
jgi:hypothetical protein